MAVYSIKNISASAVVWSSQTIQPNEAIDINYENLYDKTTDLGISQDAINVSTLAQEDKILLCIDDVASTKEDTLEFIRELHNKNNVLEIPTKFLPSKHLYNWEKVGTKLSYLGDVDVDGNLNLGTNTNTSPNLGDIWRDSNNVIKAVTEEGDAHDLWVGLGQVNGTDSHTAMTDADSLTINKFYRTGSTWTGSPIAGTSGNNQGFLLHTGSSALYGTQTFFSSNSWVHAEIWTRTKSNGTWTPWMKSASTGVNNNFSVDQTFHGQIDIGGKTKIDQNGTAIEIHGSDHTYISFFPKGGSREAYFGFPAPNTDNMILMNQNASGNLAFGTGGSTRLTISSDGNVGFGYASPNSKLEVNGGSNDSEVFRGRSDGGNGNNARFTLKAFASGGTYGGGFKIQTRDSSNVFQDRLTIDSTGNVDIGGHNVVTESPYFTDGLVSYSSDITLSGFTGHSSLQYSVSKTGLLEFYGYCYTSSLSDANTYVLNNGNPLPAGLRPPENKLFSVQCWSPTQTKSLLLSVTTSGYIILYTRDQGSGWSGTINIGMSFSYSLQ